MMKKTILIVFTILIITRLNAQVVKRLLYNGSEKETLILLSDCKSLDSLTFIKKLKSPFRQTDSVYSLKINIVDKDLVYFLKQISTIENPIIQITNFFYSPGDNWSPSGSCNIKTRIYSSANYSRYKEQTLKSINPWYKTDSSTSYVVIYRPNYTNSLIDMFKYSLKVNDTVFDIHASCKYILKFDQDTTLNIGINDIRFHQVMKVNRGRTYYIRCDAIAPRTYPISNGVIVNLNGYLPRALIVDNEIIGQIESDKIKNTR